MNNHLQPKLLLYFLLSSSLLPAQEWIHFSASDAVQDFTLSGDYLWAFGGSGLSKIDVNTQQTTTWTIVDSDLPHDDFDVLAAASDGAIWLGGFDAQKLTRFDGVAWSSFAVVGGFPITGLLDLQAGPDGKVWILGYFDPAPLYDVNLFYYENGAFTQVAPPGDSLLVVTGTAAQIGVGTDGHLWAMLRDSSNTVVYVGEFDGMDWAVHDLSASGADLGSGDQFIADSQGNLYVLVGSSLGPNFLKYDGSIWSFTTIPAQVNDFLNQQRALFADNDDVIWVSLQNNTFLQFDGQDWNTVALADYGLEDGYPDGLFIDQNGQHWIYYNHYPPSSSYRQRKLYRYDGATAHPVVLGNSNLPSNECIAIAIDDQNNKWIASNHGLIKFNGSQWEDIGKPANGYPFQTLATDPWGDVWNIAGGSALRRYDGKVFTEIPVTDSQGAPYDMLENLAISDEGVLHAATGENEVLIFDKGSASYLTNMTATVWGDVYPDYVNEVKLSPSGVLYTRGYSMQRHEGNDVWTEIPFWTNDLISNSFIVAPNEDIWVTHGIVLPGQGSNFQIYDGSGWSPFTSPLSGVSSFPQWDSEGNMWLNSAGGLCKKEGSNWTCYNQNNSPLLPDRIGAFRIDASDNLWILVKNGGVILFNENQIQNIDGTELPTAEGFIYRDYNQNEAIDPDDLPLAMQKVLLLPDSIVTFTNPDGSYQISAPPGEYELEFLPVQPWMIDNSPASYDITLTSGALEGLDFRISPSEEVRDMQVFLDEGFPRCNHISHNWVTYWNYGTQAESGELRLGPDPSVEFVTAIPPPDYLDLDTLVWTFSDLPPFGTGEVYVQWKMPDESFLDSTLIARVYIDVPGMRLDSSIANQMLVCAYDPNDKTGQSGGQTKNGQSLLADPLEYTIRFQNTGNDTAFTVIIRDTLDPQLDWETFEPTGASHPFVVSLDAGRGAIEFLFENIMLPDSNVNEAASHGFVSFRVKAREDTPSPALIENTAWIYFDLNSPIVTNTTVHTLVTHFVGVSEPKRPALQLTAFPNPSSDQVFLKLDTGSNELFEFQILDALGRVLQSGPWQNEVESPLSLREYPAGVYLIQLRNGERVGMVRVVKGG